MIVHVLTAVTRPWNIDEIACSLSAAARNAPGIELCWHLRFDHGHQHVGGQHLKNRMIDGITDGWVWILDDDTTAHEHILQTLHENQDYDAVVVSQDGNPNGRLTAHPDHARAGQIDIGQALLQRHLIGNHRIPEQYDGDGHFLETVLAGANVRYIDEPLSLYNDLEGNP